jgi:ABC-type transporter lipoprotein component MlaA
VGVVALNGLSARESAIQTVDGVREQVDPYVTVRRFYVRGRAAAIRNNQPLPNDIQKVPDSELDF